MALNVKLVAWLKFELAYLKDSVLHFSHYITETSPLLTVTVNLHCKVICGDDLNLLKWGHEFSLSLSLSLSLLPSLSSIISGKFSESHPLSTLSWCKQVLTGQPTLALPRVGVHKRTSFIISLPWFYNSVLHLFFVLLSWFLRCEVSGQTAFFIMGFFFQDLFNIVSSIIF